MKKIIILVISGLLSVTASASNWVYSGENSSLTQYIDIESISDSGIYKTAFAKSVFDQPQQLPVGTSYDSSTSLFQYDCTSTPVKYRLLSAIARKDGENVFNYNNEPLDWEFIYPETIGKETADIVCES